MIFFVVLVKVPIQNFLCKKPLFKMYVYKDRGGNRRGPSKTPKYDKFVFKLYKNRGQSC